MAYQIDFTAANYARRAWRKAVLRLLLLAAAGGAAWGVHDAYTTYNEPTLNMRLAACEAVARPIEEMDAAWDAAAKEYGALMRYYRLLWADGPTNVLGAAAGAPRLGRGFRPVRWTLAAGGPCRLDYVYTFQPGDKAEQARGLEAAVVHAVTSAVAVAGGRVDVQGVRQENLLGVDALNVTAAFALRDVRAFPAKERALAGCAEEVAALRRRVQGAKIADAGDARGAPATAQGIMMAYLALGRDKPDFPGIEHVLDVAGWFGRADRFIARHRIPGDAAERRRLRAAWRAVGDARLPWQRFRALDNAALARRTKDLTAVSDGIRRFKGFLERRHADNLRKLEPFVNAYSRSDVFNKPLVETDLKTRIAQAAGVVRARAAFADAPGAAPATLAKADETFSFTWVRWTLALGDAAGKDAERAAGADGQEEALTLGRLAACARKALALGPGYALDAVKVDFGPDGGVAGAVLEGLLPVKKVEAAKEAGGHVD